MPIIRPFLLAVLLGASAFAAELPRHGVSLTVRPVAIRETREPPARTGAAAAAASAAKSVTIEIEARRTVRGDPRVAVEWYFLARDAATRQPFVFDAARSELILQEGVSQRFAVTSAAPQNSSRKTTAAFPRRQAGDRLWGWVVLARSGNSIIASEGNLFEVREWLLKSLGAGTVDRAPAAGAK